MKNCFFECANVQKWATKYKKILNENVDKESKSTSFSDCLPGKTIARSKVWIVKNDFHIAESLTKGTCS